MSLQIPSFTGPYSVTPIANAYAWITSLTINFATGSGTVMVGVNNSATDANAGCPPIAGVPVTLGEVLAPANPNATPPVAEVDFPTLVQLVTAAAAAQQATPTLDPFGALREAIYQALLTHPTFAGSTEVA